LALLRRMGRGDVTPHGFRSTFRDWAAEQTNFPREVAEMALAHAVEDKVEAAYRRGDYSTSGAASWMRGLDTAAPCGRLARFCRFEPPASRLPSAAIGPAARHGRCRTG